MFEMGLNCPSSWSLLSLVVLLVSLCSGEIDYSIFDEPYNITDIRCWNITGNWLRCQNLDGDPYDKQITNEYERYLYRQRVIEGTPPTIPPEFTDPNRVYFTNPPSTTTFDASTDDYFESDIDYYYDTTDKSFDDTINSSTPQFDDSHRIDAKAGSSNKRLTYSLLSLDKLDSTGSGHLSELTNISGFKNQLGECCCEVIRRRREVARLVQEAGILTADDNYVVRPLATTEKICRQSSCFRSGTMETRCSQQYRKLPVRITKAPFNNNVTVVDLEVADACTCELVMLVSGESPNFNQTGGQTNLSRDDETLNEDSDTKRERDENTNLENGGDAESGVLKTVTKLVTDSSYRLMSILHNIQNYNFSNMLGTADALDSTADILKKASLQMRKEGIHNKDAYDMFVCPRCPYTSTVYSCVDGPTETFSRRIDLPTVVSGLDVTSVHTASVESSDLTRTVGTSSKTASFYSSTPVTSLTSTPTAPRFTTSAPLGTSEGFALTTPVTSSRPSDIIDTTDPTGLFTFATSAEPTSSYAHLQSPSNLATDTASDHAGLTTPSSTTETTEQIETEVITNVVTVLTTHLVINGSTSTLINSFDNDGFLTLTSVTHSTTVGFTSPGFSSSLSSTPVTATTSNTISPPAISSSQRIFSTSSLKPSFSSSADQFPTFLSTTAIRSHPANTPESYISPGPTFVFSTPSDAVRPSNTLTDQPAVSLTELSSVTASSTALTSAPLTLGSTEKAPITTLSAGSTLPADREVKLTNLIITVSDSLRECLRNESLKAVFIDSYTGDLKSQPLDLQILLMSIWRKFVAENLLDGVNHDVLKGCTREVDGKSPLFNIRKDKISLLEEVPEISGLYLAAAELAHCVNVNSRCSTFLGDKLGRLLAAANLIGNILTHNDGSYTGVAGVIELLTGSSNASSIIAQGVQKPLNNLLVKISLINEVEVILDWVNDDRVDLNRLSITSLEVLLASNYRVKSFLRSYEAMCKEDSSSRKGVTTIDSTLVTEVFDKINSVSTGTGVPKETLGLLTVTGNTRPVVSYIVPNIDPGTTERVTLTLNPIDLLNNSDDSFVNPFITKPANFSSNVNSEVSIQSSATHTESDSEFTGIDTSNLNQFEPIKLPKKKVLQLIFGSSPLDR